MAWGALAKPREAVSLLFFFLLSPEPLLSPDHFVNAQMRLGSSPPAVAGSGFYKGRATVQPPCSPPLSQHLERGWLQMSEREVFVGATNGFLKGNQKACTCGGRRSCGSPPRERPCD